MITKISQFKYTLPQAIQRNQVSQPIAFKSINPLSCDTVSFQKQSETKTTLLAKLEKLRERKAKIPHNVVVISGPSGVGKDTIMDAMREKGYEFVKSISYTTRAPRKDSIKMPDGTFRDEIDGVDYKFISREQFAQMHKDGLFFDKSIPSMSEEEKAAGMVIPTKGTCYGGVKAESEAKRLGHDLVYNISADASGTIVKAFGGGTVSVFIKPPSMEEVERRLIKRGTDSSEEIAKRLSAGREQMTYMSNFDKVIMNDNLETAAEETFRYLESRQGWMVKSFNKAIRMIEEKLKLMA